VTAGALPSPVPGGHRAGVRAGARRGGHRAGGHRGGGQNGTRRAQGAAAAGDIAARVLASALCCGVAIFAVRENYMLRGFEATLASRAVAAVTSRPAGPVPLTPTFWFTVGPHHQMALEITSACTVVLMMTPFLIGTAFLAWRRSSSVVRPLAACAVAMAMLMVVNQLRILTIVEFVLHMGYKGGFYWGHTLVGSLITIAGGSLTLVVYVLIVVKRRTPGRARLSAH
jgi:exosortase/archaeosortase family protein